MGNQHPDHSGHAEERRCYRPPNQGALLTGTEDDACSVLGAIITQFGFENGKIVLALNDGREIFFGSDGGRVWFYLQEYTVH